MRQIVTMITLLFVGALLGGSLYDTLVLAPNLHGGPQGLEHGRLFMAAATPANFFRLISPASQALAFIALVTVWKSPPARWRLLGAVVALVLADVVTFTYHYPRNDIMFTAPLTVAPEGLSLVAQEWQSANYLRVALVFAAWLATMMALARLTPKQSRSIA